ncbi:hypothetical protein P43SY_002789 [Pythium insidiosum]|uniref:Protein kinase domain-containing protein n=1 Tax=Pythium insidiosum TaxID=114742 RepID=A0AAD5QB57_PYTIN|nr:hypothetical protein P43SY_002789 [Pythium insidiosum]
MEAMAQALQVIDDRIDRMHSIERLELEALAAREILESTPAVASSRFINGAHSWYTVGKAIGKGTFGRVQLARHRITDHSVAIKTYYREKGASVCCAPPSTTTRTQSKGAVVSPSSARRPVECDALEWKRVRQEVRLMASLQPHPGLIQFIEAFETPTQLHVVMELASGGSLIDLLKHQPQQRLPERCARRIFAGLCSAIAALHLQNVIHRDLKLENVLLDDQLRPKVIDFGFSQLEFSLKETMTTTGRGIPPRSQTALGLKNFCGTPSYMAPEVVACKTYDGRSVDVWSLGVILYLLLCGRFPFQGASLPQLYNNIRSTPLKVATSVSKAAQSLLHGILVVDPAKRLTMADILSHPWLAEPVNSHVIEERRTLEAFLAWQPGKAMLINRLESWLSLRSSETTLALRAGRRNCITAMLTLAVLTTAKDMGVAPPTSEALSCSDGSNQDSASSDARPPPIDMSIDPSEIAETRGGTHKAQLEALIGLVQRAMH